MALKVVDMIPGLKQNAAVDFPADMTIGGSSVVALSTITSTSANSLTVGPNGTTNPAFNVDSSTGSQAAGLNVVGATAAGTVAVAVTSSGAAAALSVDALGTGVLKLGGTSTGQVSIARGARKQVIAGSTLTALGSNQSVTPTAAQCLGGFLSHVSVTGAGTCTFPTGTLLSGAVTGVAVGDSFECVYANIGNQTVTLTGDTGSVIVGTAAVATGLIARISFYNTGSNTWNLYCHVSA